MFLRPRSTLHWQIKTAHQLVGSKSRSGERRTCCSCTLAVLAGEGPRRYSPVAALAAGEDTLSCVSTADEMKSRQEGVVSPLS